MQESLAGVRVVKSFAREEFEINKYEKQNLALRELNMSAMRLAAWNQPLLILVLNIIAVVVLWIGGIAVINHHLTLGTLVAATQYVFLLTTPVRSFGYMINWFVRGVSGGTRIFAVLDTPSEIKDAPDAYVLQRARGYVTFEQVTFAYSNGIEVLHTIDIEAKPGQVVAILGTTGSGKSSILNLLPRFYDVTGGCVMVDGHDVRDVTQASLRRNVGLVLQDVFLFSGTVESNIRLGQSSITDERVRWAANEVHADRFIQRLHEGYKTEVKERGAGLSVGQKQLISLARALAFDPALLILDEATSSIDTETEQLIQRAIERVMLNRTSIVVAHRLSTIQRAERIIVLHHGEIREQGSHQELLAQRGLYWRLYKLQYADESRDEQQDPTGTFRGQVQYGD